MPGRILSLLYAAGVLPALATAGERPEIAFITEPACNSEPMVLTGEGFDPGRAMVKAICVGHFDQEKPQDPLQLLDSLDRRPELPATPPDNAQDCRILGGGERFLQVEFRCVPQQWVRAPLTSAVWIGDGTTWSEPYLVNRPQAQWVYPKTQVPDEPIRIFGRTFAWGHHLPSALAFLRRAGTSDVIALRGASQHHEDGHTERWSLSAWLPPDLAPGEYELFVHGRHGGPHGWSDPLQFTVAPVPDKARPVVNIRDHGGVGDGLADDTAALEAALKQASPGGTVYLPAGVWAISRTVEIPEDVVLQGVSQNQTIIANRQTPAVDPRTLTESRGTFDGSDLLRGMRRFALRDLTLRFMPARGSALRVGKDPEWSEDVSLFRVRLETRQDFSLAEHPYVSRPLNIVKARNFSMVRCETDGPGVPDPALSKCFPRCGESAGGSRTEHG